LAGSNCRCFKLTWYAERVFVDIIYNRIIIKKRVMLMRDNGIGKCPVCHGNIEENGNNVRCEGCGIFFDKEIIKRNNPPLKPGGYVRTWGVRELPGEPG